MSTAASDDVFAVIPNSFAAYAAALGDAESHHWVDAVHDHVGGVVTDENS